MTGPAVVELGALTVRLGRRTVLDRLSGSLRARSIGLLGPNGAGKTTLLNALLGFHAPSSGRVSVLGHDLATEPRAARALTGYMPENDAFVAGMSAVRFVRMAAELHGLPPAQALERAHEALWYVGLGEARYRPLETYSLGMKQLVKLAQAIVHAPRLLLLDEPTNGLDPPARSRMLQLIRDVQASGTTHVLLSSHLLRDVEECCEEVLVLKGGRIAVHCDLAEERTTNRRFLELEAEGDEEGFREALQALGCEWAPSTRRRFKLLLPDGLDVRDLFAVARERKVRIRRLTCKRDSLEEIFLKAMEAPDGGV